MKESGCPDESDDNSDCGEASAIQLNSSYFSSYENLDVHRLMLEDRPRTGSYREAMFQNKTLFQDKIVLDVGCGTGILSLFAAEAGASKVYAIEASSISLIARAVIRQNNLQGVIEVFSCQVEDLVLPNCEKVDVIISEWMGFYLLHESMLDSVIMARNKFLKDTGILFPCTASLYACPSGLNAFYREEINFWDNVYGYDFSAAKMAVLQNKQRSPQILTVDSSEHVSDPNMIKEFDLMRVSPAEVKEFESRFFTSSLEDSICRGIVLWFDCTFPSGSVSKDGVVLSTSPKSPPTHWKQTVIVLPCAISLEAGDVIGFSIKMSQSALNHRHYDIGVEVLPDDVEHPVPCHCGLMKCKLIKAFMQESNEFVENGVEY